MKKSVLNFLNYFLGYMIVFQFIALVLGFNQVGIIIFSSAVTLGIALVINYKYLIQQLSDVNWKRMLINIGKYQLIIYAGNFILSMLIGMINHNEAVNQVEIEGLVKVAPLMFAFMTCIMAPIVEELVFRYSIDGFMKKHFNKWVYILVSGLSFGLLHVISGSISNPLDFLYVFLYGYIGCVLAYAYLENDRNLIYPIGIHFVNNLIGVIIILLV
ncbi:MAG: type II CAAX endopeptidase family protein [Erysipelotrichaceae bacterium]